MNNPGKNDVLVEVFCTWNKFFLSARAEDKSVAEQNAAKATLNKVIVFACVSFEFSKLTLPREASQVNSRSEKCADWIHYPKKPL